MKEKKQSCVLSGDEALPLLVAERSLCWKSFLLLVCIFNSVIIKVLYVFIYQSNPQVGIMKVILLFD